MAIAKKPKIKDHHLSVINDLEDENMKRLNSYMDAKLFYSLKQRALDRKTTIKDLLHQAVSEFLDK